MKKSLYIEEQKNGFLNSSPLFNKTGYFKLFPFRKKKDLSSQMDIPEIPDKLVLGKRMEIFFNSYLRALGLYKILASGIQVMEDKVTIGELDFLIRELGSEQVIHLELVYKFYLYDPSKRTETKKWVGPNQNDALSNKIQKLKEKQLPLLHRRSTTQILNSLGINDETISQEVCFLGQLFVPYSMQGVFFPNVNHNAIQGYWVNLYDFIKTHAIGDSYYIPDKENWIMEVKDVSNWNSITETEAQCKKSLNSKKSIMCFKKTCYGIYSRFFVVWW